MDPRQTDDDLARLLRGHLNVAPKASPDFRSAVWRRIEARRAEENRWTGWLRLHRAPVASAALASLALSVGLGNWAASLQTRQVRERWVEQYVASIDHGVRTSLGEGP
ncbi:MAG: hypothetical protein U1F77_04940 [Kiritimatiellia bacterium]